MADSPQQKQFLLNEKKKKIFVHFMRILLFIGFLSLWEISACLGWIDSFIFSSPLQIVRTFLLMMTDHQLSVHILVTVLETFLSFLLVVIFGVGISVLLWLSPRIASVLEPYLVILNSLPKSALAPLLIVWLGANIRTIIVAGMSVAIFGSVISLYTGFMETDEDKLKLIYTLGGNKRDTLFKVVLPSSIPYLLSIMKVNIGLCLVGVVIGEFIGARMGLGYLIIYSSQVFKLDWMLMSITLLCMIAMGFYSILNFLEKYILKR
ncbi:MAG: ABC transporter permease [Clostridia bacterium]|nr:ABC transporter permease [Clostridia bacterium]NCC42574.1 ABC transporter permease [Clostridia bacterium]